MIGLIKKDLYYLGSSWKVLLLSVLMIGGFTSYKGFGAILICILPTFFGLSILGCIQQDAQKNWYQYYKVLPMVPNKVVASRYISFLVFILIGVLISIVYGLFIEFTMGAASLGKNFTLLQGLEMGIALALGFGAFFIPATYYYKGEKMELSMIISSFFSFGALYVASKILTYMNINLMEYSHVFIQIASVCAIVVIAISWFISNVIYNKRRYQ